MIERWQLTLAGRVQGVALRYHTWLYARKNNLGGWIKNQDNGSVILEIEGEATKLKDFVERIKLNPGWSRIDHLEIEIVSVLKEKKFKIHY
ncbi:MAG: acylphosphatase [Patescibacteria group bacterium]